MGLSVQGLRAVVVLGFVGLSLVGCRAAPHDAGPAQPEPAIAEPTPVVVPVVAAVERPAEAEPEPETVASATVAPVEPVEPPPFEGQKHVRLHELIAELERVAEDMSTRPAVRSDYEALVAQHDLEDSDALFHDYVRVKLAFEATRDGGLWNLRWTITNEQPNSEKIWAQWNKATASDDIEKPTADAECDELSAVFAFVARKLGVRHIGLFWPTWNHVVAVWTVQSSDETPVRIVVPTSQIFLGADDSLGTTGFDPWTQKKIYEYRRRDIKDDHRIDAALARFFVQRAREHAGLSQVELQRLRNERDLALNQPEIAAEAAADDPKPRD